LLAVLLWWIWFASVVFAVACAWRVFKYATAPEHLRWDLYPVAHEPGRDHGGSYLEEKDWWTKPRSKSLWGEVSFMFEEIVFLKGVWVNNRTLWYGSLPFHWGLYLLVLTSVGLVAAAFGLTSELWLGLLRFAGVVGGALTALGGLALLVARTRDPRLRPYTTPLDRLNLALIAILGGLSVAVAIAPGGMAHAAVAVGQMLRLSPPEVSLLFTTRFGGTIERYSRAAYWKSGCVGRWTSASIGRRSTYRPGRHGPRLPRPSRTTKRNSGDRACHFSS
jgi:nitrate reductase gamma subunit